MNTIQPMVPVEPLYHDILAQLSARDTAPTTLVELAQRLVKDHPDTTLHDVIIIVRQIIQRDGALRETALTMLGEQSFMLNTYGVSAT